MTTNCRSDAALRRQHSFDGCWFRCQGRMNGLDNTRYPSVLSILIKWSIYHHLVEIMVCIDLYVIQFFHATGLLVVLECIYCMPNMGDQARLPRIFVQHPAYFKDENDPIFGGIAHLVTLFKDNPLNLSRFLRKISILIFGHCGSRPPGQLACFVFPLESKAVWISMYTWDLYFDILDAWNRYRFNSHILTSVSTIVAAVFVGKIHSCGTGVLMFMQG